MKVNRHEVHDRLDHFLEDQRDTIQKGIEDCIYRNPMAQQLLEYSSYIYIRISARTADDGVTKRMLYEPLLVKPLSSPNAMLIRYEKYKDILEILWNIPDERYVDQFTEGHIFENEIITYSINEFIKNKERLDKTDPRDLSLPEASKIYAILSRKSRDRKVHNLSQGLWRNRKSLIL